MSCLPINNRLKSVITKYILFLFLEPEYSSKIFLDCCGLVRRAQRDLHKQFGFKLGPWNQGYMYDTLPITVEREEDMKPGDLVFISATYYNTKSRYFIWNNVTGCPAVRIKSRYIFKYCSQDIFWKVRIFFNIQDTFWKVRISFFSFCIIFFRVEMKIHKYLMSIRTPAQPATYQQ